MKKYILAIIFFVSILIIGTITVNSTLSWDNNILGDVVGIFEKPLTVDEFNGLCNKTNGTVNGDDCKCYYPNSTVIYVNIKLKEVDNSEWQGCGDWSSNKNETTTTPDEFVKGCTSDWIPQPGVCICYNENKNWNFAVNYRDVYHVDWQGCGDWSMWDKDNW